MAPSQVQALESPSEPPPPPPQAPSVPHTPAAARPIAAQNETRTSEAAPAHLVKIAADTRLKLPETAQDAAQLAAAASAACVSCIPRVLVNEACDLYCKRAVGLFSMRSYAPLHGTHDRNVACRAWEDGVLLQHIEWLLPEVGDTALAVQQQFSHALQMTERMLRLLKRSPGLEGQLRAELLQEDEPVGACR